MLTPMGVDIAAARNNRRAGLPHAINRASNNMQRRNIGRSFAATRTAPEAIHDQPAEPGLAQGRTAHEWPAVGQDSVVPALAQTTARPLAAPRRTLPLVASAGLPPFSGHMLPACATVLAISAAT
jgi:hypothetical protein